MQEMFLTGRKRDVGCFAGTSSRIVCILLCVACVINRSSREYASFIQICKEHSMLLGVV